MPMKLVQIFKTKKGVTQQRQNTFEPGRQKCLLNGSIATDNSLSLDNLSRGKYKHLGYIQYMKVFTSNKPKGFLKSENPDAVGIFFTF